MVIFDLQSVACAGLQTDVFSLPCEGKKNWNVVVSDSENEISSARPFNARNKSFLNGFFGISNEKLRSHIQKCLYIWCTL
jgi:hypothetical protein